MEWRRSREEALNEIKGGTRLVLTFYYRPDCEGSQKTMSEVFTSEKVAGLAERETVPVKCDIQEHRKPARENHIEWTPTFTLSDENGRELERWIGFLPEKDFMEQLLLSKGLAAFHLERYREAIMVFEELSEEYPDSQLLPEAEFYLGLARFKETGEREPLFEAGHHLNITHPESPWAKKSSIWSHSLP